MSGFAGNPENRFCRVEAHIKVMSKTRVKLILGKFTLNAVEPSLSRSVLLPLGTKLILLE